MNIDIYIIRYNLDVISNISDEVKDKLCVDLGNELLKLLQEYSKVDEYIFNSCVSKIEQQYNVLMKRSKISEFWEYFTENYICEIESKLIEKYNIHVPFPKYHFDTLKVSTNATIDDVKKAYRNLAIIHHPDKGGDSNLFNLITESKKICIEYLLKIQS